MKNVLAFTGGRRVASGRFRVEQYTAPLAEHGIRMAVASAPLGSYPPAFRPLRPAWAVTSALSRIPSVLRSRAFDVVLLQRALLSTLHTFERFTARPRIFDVDDAIWLAARGENVGRIAGRCDRVIAGNAFLAEYFRQFCNDVVVIPTAVDDGRFFPVSERDDDSVIIGWSGQSSAGRELAAISGALSRICRARPQVRVRIICDRPVSLPSVPVERIEFIRWSPSNEVPAIQSFDIALMPLEDGPWQRGKCSYKMLLSMSCGTPVVVSPVGMNREILEMGDVGRSAATSDQWFENIIDLVDSPALRSRLGANGRQIVERNFSVRSIAPRLAVALGSLN